MVVELHSERIFGLVILLWLNVFHCYTKRWSLGMFVSPLRFTETLIRSGGFSWNYAFSRISMRERWTKFPTLFLYWILLMVVMMLMIEGFEN